LFSLDDGGTIFGVTAILNKKDMSFDKLMALPVVGLPGQENRKTFLHKYVHPFKNGNYIDKSTETILGAIKPGVEAIMGKYDLNINLNFKFC
jgi:hypothetical protein